MLLRKAEENGFVVFVTSDKNLQYQQNVRKLKLAVVVFDVRSNRLEDCIPKCALLLAKLPDLEPGTVTLI